MIASRCGDGLGFSTTGAGLGFALEDDWAGELCADASPGHANESTTMKAKIRSILF